MKRSKRGRSFVGAIVLAILYSASGTSAVTAGSGDALHSAAERNDTAAMAALIAGGADVDAGDDRGITPLHRAAQYNSYEATELLLDNGAGLDPIAESKGIRYTPLVTAVAAGSVEVAVLLISRGAGPDMPPNEGGITLLHMAAGSNDPRIASALVAAGLDPNARTSKGSTPLHMAARKAAHETAALLLDAGAEPDARDDIQRTPLHYAACQRTPETGRLLIERGADVNAGDERGLTPLHRAACKNAHETAATLLDAGANANAVASNGYTPLHMAATENALESAKLLVARGAEVEPPRKEGVPTPLLTAVQCKAAEVALFLIDQGAALAVEDEAGATLPSLAEENGLHDVVLHLVEQGEPLDAEYADPGALLRAAVESDAPRTVSLLLERGADVNVKDEYSGSSLLHLAAGHDGHEVVPLLIAHGVDVDVRDFHGWTPLHDAAESDAREAALALIEQGADLDARDGDDKTPLHRAAAAWEGAPRTAALLADHGASVDAKDPAGWTPLHHALAGHAPRDVAGMLIDRGADAGAATALAGWTPLHLATHLNDPGLVAALLARGAPVNAQTRIGGWTPLHLALRLEGADEVAAMLRAAGAEDRTHDVAAFPPVYSYGGLLYSSGEFVFSRSRKLRPSEMYAIPSADFFGGGSGRPAARGSFTAPGAKERLVFERLGFAPYLDDHAEAVGLVDESGAARVLWITDHRYPFETLCRDPLTGLHHAIFKRAYGGSGNPGDVVHMYYDPERGTLVDGLVEKAYLEWYEDGVSSKSSASPTAAGECRWRAKKAAIATWVDALDALRVGTLAEWGAAGGEPIVLPTRVIPSPVAESSLDELRKLPADVASVSDGLMVRDHNLIGEWRDEELTWTVESPRWDVVVASGTKAGDYRYHDGVVLVRDKERDEWRSIHDCRGIAVRNVRGNTLFADFFDNCGVDSDDWTGHTRHHFKVDLLTWKAQRVEGWEPCEAPATLEERERCEE